MQRIFRHHYESLRKNYIDRHLSNSNERFQEQISQSHNKVFLPHQSNNSVGWSQNENQELELYTANAKQEYFQKKLQNVNA